MANRPTWDCQILWRSKYPANIIISSSHQHNDHRFASDQQYWSVKFLEAWDIMATNGYTDLEAGPEAGWLGYYSLDKASINNIIITIIVIMLLFQGGQTRCWSYS